jgi:DNA-binding MarR family transcriptional regulator
MSLPRDAAEARTGEEFAALLLAVLPVLSRHLARRLRERGAISVERFKALHVLRDRPRKSGEVARLVLLSPAALTRLADGLVSDGLVVRVADARDRRAVTLALTDVGTAELARGHRIVSEALDEMLGRLGPAELARLRAGLSDLLRAVEPVEPPEARS